MLNKNILLIVCAYCICVVFRFYYPLSIYGINEFMWNDTFMLNTNDAYFYAEGARDIMEGIKNTNLSPTYEILPIITAFLVQVLHIDIDVLMFYLPGFVGSLVVFPIVISLYYYGGFNIFVSLFCGVLSGIGVSYYNRTMFGYYDTDMLVIVLLLFIAMFILRYLYRNTLCSIFAILLLSLFALTYYHSLVYVLFGFLLVLFCFKRSVSLDILCISYASFLVLYELFGVYVSLLSLFLPFVMYIDRRYIAYIFYFVLFVFVVFVAYSVLPSVLGSAYFNKDSIVSNSTFHYFGVINTISETSNIDFSTFAYRVSGGIFWFIIGCLGLILLFFKKREFLIFLPFVVLGFFAYFKGLRFSFYSVSVFAIGVGYFLVFVLEYIKSHKTISTIIGILYAFVALFAHVMHIRSYIIPPVLNNSEVRILNEIPSEIGDYAISWWDYGYIIRYYSKLNTIIDGGIHEGHSNYPVSLILSGDSENLSYNLSKILPDMSFEEFLKKNNYTPNKAIEALESSSFRYETSKNIYIILPLRMLNIFPAVSSFSKINITSGETFKLGVFMLSQVYIDNKAYFKNGIKLDTQSGYLTLNGDVIQVGEIIDLKSNSKKILTDSKLVAIILKDNRVLVCDREYLDSFYFKAVLFKNLDSRLFKEVLSNDSIIVYKVNKG